MTLRSHGPIITMIPIKLKQSNVLTYNLGDGQFHIENLSELIISSKRI